MSLRRHRRRLAKKPEVPPRIDNRGIRHTIARMATGMFGLFMVGLGIRALAAGMAPFRNIYNQPIVGAAITVLAGAFLVFLAAIGWDSGVTKAGHPRRKGREGGKTV